MPNEENMMKGVCSAFWVSFLTLAQLTAQEAPWEKTAGPPGVEVRVIYKANNIFYAGTGTLGVYRSTDNGMSWSPANHGIERTTIHDMIASGGNLLAAAAASNCPNSINVFKSTDNGANWTPTTGLSNSVVSSFAIKDGFVYAGTFNVNGSGIFRSSDNGDTWQELPSPIDTGDKIFVSDNAIIVASDNFIWRSTNDGNSWDVVEEFALTGIHSFARAGTTLFAAETSGIDTSTDNGASWNFTPFQNSVSSFSSDGSTIYLGSSDKVFKSTDEGTTWIDVSTSLGKGVIAALLFDGTSLLAGTPDDAAGIYRSTNGGSSWVPVATGLPVASNVRSLISFGDSIFAGTQGDGIYRSSDRGDTWTKTDPDNPLLTGTLVFTFCTKDDALYAGAANGIYKSTDGGATFETILNGFPTNINVTAYSLTVSNGNILAAVSVSFSASSGLDAIFYSNDDGNSWHQSNLPVEAVFVSSVASDGSPLAYAGVYTQSFSTTGLYKSTDGGLTWASRTTSLSVDIERIAVNGSNVLASTLFTAYYSTDFGEVVWIPSSLPGSALHGGVDTYTLRGNSIYAGNESMYVSTNSGASWTPIREGMPACPWPQVQASCSDNSYLYGGTFGEGVWRKAIDFIYPSPTPHPSITPTPTPKVTPTPTVSPTPNGTATPSATPTATVGGTPTPPAHALNLSTRMLVLSGDQVGIGGFIITGNAPKQILLRGIGPSLSKFGVPNALADPMMELHGPTGFDKITNNNWRDTQEAEIQATGSAPTNDLESAILVTLDPGPYTAIVKSQNKGTGVGLVEVYDLNQAAASELGNISTRAFVSTGSDIMIAGFILGGNNGDDSVILRGLGPSLSDFGVPNPLNDPTLELRDNNGALLRDNDNWHDDPAQAALITAAGLALPNNLECGIAATLPPGQYTALLAGVGGTGNGLVEAYDRGSPQ